MKKVFHALTVALVALTATQGLAKTYSQSELDALWKQTGNRQRKLVTSNSAHYWAWAANEADGYVGDYLGPKGVVIGDPHPRNVFDYRNGGKAMLAVADIDDGGRAPLFIDIVRYITYTETLDVKMKIGDIFGAYVKGLQGEETDVPSALKDARKQSAKDIKEKHAKYIKKHTKDGKLDLEDLELTGKDDFKAEQKRTLTALSREALERTGEKEVLDAGYKVNDSGSSADMDRYWLLLGEGGDARLLLEFKELSKPAVGYYQRQANNETRVKEVLEHYSEEGLDEKLFGVVTVGSKAYWMRPRKYQALDLDDEELTAKDQKEFVKYMANWMGLSQREQSSGKSLLKLIEDDEKTAKKALEEMVRAYLKEMGE